MGNARNGDKKITRGLFRKVAVPLRKSVN